MRRLILFLLLSLPVWAATGDVTAVRVLGSTCAAGTTACNGWVAEIDLEGMSTGGTYAMGLSSTNDPQNAKIVLSVTSPGYDASGNATTIARKVYGINPLRKPYPNQTTQDETAGTPLTVRVVLSEYIYSGDTVTATLSGGFYTQGTANNAASSVAVTNNSTVAYPKVVARWAWPGYEVMTGSTFLLEAVAFDRFPKAKKPVSAVVFSCSDAHSHTVSATVSSMSLSTRSGDANPVQVYAANISTAGLTQGDVATCNFKAYPWVGDSVAVADSSTGTAGNESLGPLLALVDTAGTYGQAHAYVKPDTGSDASCTGLVFNTRAEAEASTGFATWGKAFTCAKAYGSRANANDNIFIWVNGTIAIPGANAPTVDQGAQNTWTQIAPATGSTCTIGSGSNAKYRIRLLKISGCAINSSSVGQFSGTATTDQLWWDNLPSVTCSGSPCLYSYQMFYGTRSNLTTVQVGSLNGFVNYSTSKLSTFVRGNTGPAATMVANAYTVLGNKQVTGRFLGAGEVASGQAISDNAVYAYNSVLGFPQTGGNAIYGTTSATVTTTNSIGMAIVQNLIEKTAATTPLFYLFADGTRSSTTNIMLWHNTFVGERTNLMYSDGTSSLGADYANVHTQLSSIGNIFSNENIKSDTFANPTASGLRTGNWGPRMGTGRISNASITRSGTSACDSTSNYFNSLGVSNTFGPEHAGLYMPTGGNDAVTPGYVSDKSCGGDGGTGNGDYHLSATSVLRNVIPATQIAIPYDLDGKPRASTGFSAVGAYEYPGNTKSGNALMFSIP